MFNNRLISGSTLLIQTQIIEPISAQQRQKVVDVANSYIDQASRTWGQSFARLPIHFDLKGRTAGMYKVKNRLRVIRFNPYLFAKYFKHNLAITVPHEIAHYIADCLYDAASIKPHGIEWRTIMESFGVEASVTGKFDLAGIPQKTYRRYDYRCACMIHQLTSIRHYRILRGEGQYRCRKCNTRLSSAQKN